jgi:hypothetical protein
MTIHHATATEPQTVEDDAELPKRIGYCHCADADPSECLAQSFARFVAHADM